MKFPETFRKAQQYQGAFNYYLRQTPDLSALMSPLSKEIAKGKKYVLTDEIISNLKVLREKYEMESEQLISNTIRKILIEKFSSPPIRVFTALVELSEMSQ